MTDTPAPKPATAVTEPTNGSGVRPIDSNLTLRGVAQLFVDRDEENKARMQLMSEDIQWIRGAVKETKADVRKLDGSVHKLDARFDVFASKQDSMGENLKTVVGVLTGAKKEQAELGAQVGVGLAEAAFRDSVHEKDVAIVKETVTTVKETVTVLDERWKSFDWVRQLWKSPEGKVLLAVGSFMIVAAFKVIIK